jgi:hypothetical protein
MKLRHPRALAASFLLCGMLGAAPATAQLTPIKAGQTLQGKLTDADPVLTSYGPFKVYAFEARAGERLTATMRSEEFDAYLRLDRQVGGITDEIDADDDGGGETDARIRFTVPESGTYLLVAESLEPTGSGDFTIALETTPPPTTADARPIKIGQTLAGELAETDAIQEDDETFYDSWTIAARAGQRLVATMQSEAFDTYMWFGTLDANGEFSVIASTDDGDVTGDRTDARLRVTVPEDGVYVIHANSVDVSTGPYQLTVFEGPPPAETAAQAPIEAGDQVDGRLDEADAVLDDDTYYEYWIYQGKAGERITIRMKAEFDTFLGIGKLDRAEFTELDSNDDGPDGSTDSELSVTLPADGTYAIRATSVDPGKMGDYELSVARAR